MIRFEWEGWKGISPETLLHPSRFKDECLQFTPMGDVTYRLALWAQEGQGIYVFHDKNWVPYYIGKCTGRTFLGRISAHLDTHYHKGGLSSWLVQHIPEKMGTAFWVHR